MKKWVRKGGLAWIVVAVVLLAAGPVFAGGRREYIFGMKVTAPLRTTTSDGETYYIMVEQGRGKDRALEDDERPFRYITDLLIYAVKAEERAKASPQKKAIQELTPIPKITVHVTLSSRSETLYFWVDARGTWIEASRFVGDDRPDPDTQIDELVQKGRYVSFRVLGWHPEDTDTADG